MEIIGKKEYAKTALDENVEAFVVHMTPLSLNSMPIYPAREAQIALLVIEKVQIPELDEHVEAFVMHVTSLSLNLIPIHPAQKAQIALLVIKELQIPELDKHFEAFVVHVTSLLTMPIYPARKAQITSLVTKEVKIPTKYSDFSNVFLDEKASILPKVTELNRHAIKLQKGQQLPYGPIYSLDLVELKTLKTYIEINFANGFFWPSKSPTSAPIFFVGKLDGSFRLCVDYWGLNNLTIKNQYLLSFIGELLDQLGQAKRFTQLDLISTYYQMKIKEGDK